jgi:hypothetical protein
MRDAYLASWESVAPHANLARAFAVAYQLSHISSARNWHKLVVRLVGEERAQEAGSVPYKLRQFLIAAARL